MFSSCDQIIADRKDELTIIFNCGTAGQPVNIAINTGLQVSKVTDTVIDRARMVTSNGNAIFQRNGGITVIRS